MILSNNSLFYDDIKIHFNMKKRFLFLALFLLPHFVLAQTDWSYISIKTYTSADGTTWMESVSVDNGLGDVERNVNIGITPSRKDIVNISDYDEYRNPYCSWLPIVSSNGLTESIKSLKRTAQDFYKDTNPYQVTVYAPEPMPFDEEKFKAGKAWQEHKQGYKMVNTMLHPYEYRLADFHGSKEFACSCIDFFSGKIINDEDGKTSAELFDPSGKYKLVSFIKNDKSRMVTYYVYDKSERLRYILPPAISSEFDGILNPNFVIDESSKKIQDYAYIYKYDGRGNVIYKKLPGCAPEYFVYDKKGQCVFSQDGNQRKSGVWMFTIPDVFGRKALTGVCSNKIDYLKEPLYDIVVNAKLGSDMKYQINGIDLVSQIDYITFYYDNYSFVGYNGFDKKLAFSFLPTNLSGKSFSAKGAQTGAKIAILSGDSISGYKYSVSYYDEWKRIIESKTTDCIGGFRAVYTEYDFQGHPIKTLNVYQRNGDTNQEYTVNTYDHAGRLLKTTHQLNDNPEVVLAENEYDELGRLISNKKFANSKIATEYKYNIQSWISSIKTSDLFEEKLYYNEIHHGNTPLFAGNITAQDWKADSKERGYNYQYDNLNQLVKAKYFENNTNNDHYSTEYAYDVMGNITSLKRSGLQDGGTFGLIDNLEYSYNGNLLMSVNDKVTSPTYNNATDFHGVSNNDAGGYEYDANGNLIRDDYKKFTSISYNFLNLPCKFKRTQDVILYQYDAVGEKQKIKWNNGHISEKEYDYCDNYIYEDGVLKQILIPDGYITFSNNKPVYHAFIKDHLGSNRVVVDQNGNKEQVNHYYPYGGLMAESTDSEEQQFKYNGKEFNPMSGINLYDYGARFYDPAIGRFTTQDPLAEKYGPTSPYVYCLNNPMNCVDPDGKKVVLFGTKLPADVNSEHPWLHIIAGSATHTFIAVIDDKTNKLNGYFAFGPKEGLGIFNEPLEKMDLNHNMYEQDKMIIDEFINGTAAQDDRCKYAVEFQTVDPQDQERFDKKVIATGNSYSPLPSTKYRLAPSESDGTVNCNKGSYNLLKQAGVSKQLLKAIGERIPGKIWGWGQDMPWTQEEQQKAQEKQ